MKMVEVALPRKKQRQAVSCNANETRGRFLNDFDTFFSESMPKVLPASRHSPPRSEYLQGLNLLGS